ncbi:hypothetical protein, partial [Herbiconiux daphne]
MEGYIFTNEVRKKMRLAKLGVKRDKISVEKSRIGIALSAQNSPIISCPHCGLEGKAIQLKKWHFDNCPKLTGKMRYADIVTCPHCQKIGKHGHLQRHHFDNCKYKVGE